MGYAENGYFVAFVVHCIDDPVVTHVQTTPFASLEFAATARAWIFGEGSQSGLDPVLHSGCETGHLFLCPTFETDRVSHQSPVTLPSRISLIACSSGTTSKSPLS